MSAIHISRYAPIRQELSADAAGVEALFTDAVRAHVASQSSAPALHSASTAIPLCNAKPSAQDSGTPAGWPEVARLPFGACPSLRDILVDCELGRLARLRLETRQFVLWGYAHKFADGEGRITRATLCNFCIMIGLTTNRRTFNAWIQAGMGLYWRERDGYLYLTGYKKLSARLTKYAAKFHPDWIATNLPGQQRVALDLTGSLQSIHAKLYGGWLAVKAAKTGYLDISRYTLGALFGCSRPAMLGYEKLLGIRVTERYAETADIHHPHIPAHATLHIDFDGHEFVSWQISNRYEVSAISIHPANGQRRKIRKACRRQVEMSTPADKKHGGVCRLHRTGRITFHDKATKRGFVTAYKQVDRHLRKHQDSDLRRHYAYMTRRYGKLIYELSTGDCLRSADMGIDRTAERSGAFELRRMQYRMGWASRVGA